MFKLLKFVILLVVVLGVVGYFRGWFEVSKSGDDSYNVKINRETIDQDTKKAKETAKDAVGKLKDGLAKDSEVVGQLTSLNVLGGTFTVTTAQGEASTFSIGKDMKDNTDALTVLGALEPGQDVKVCFKKLEDGKLEATSVELVH
ncbi:MAG: hypothetical protein R3F20_03585 [Planctomycetota bacterium]